MKKIFLTFFLLLIFVPSVFADRNTTSIANKTSSELIKRGDWKVYRVSYNTTANNGSFAIYDCLTEYTATDDVITPAEGSEATSGNGKVIDFTNKPIQGSTGLYLWINNASVCVEYE